MKATPYAALLSAALSEHLKRPSATCQSQAAAEPSSLDGSFELLEKDRLQQLREKFETVVFNTVETDEKAIQECLESLFPTHDLKKTLRGMQNRLRSDKTATFEFPNAFDDNVLDWVIRGLLHSDLLKKERKALPKTCSCRALLCPQYEVGGACFLELD